ncbi:MAG TPA: helix-turn-helix transcriptional regulator [Solirubrobacteraceae bacterium]
MTTNSVVLGGDVLRAALAVMRARRARRSRHETTALGTASAVAVRKTRSETMSIALGPSAVESRILADNRQHVGKCTPCRRMSQASQLFPCNTPNPMPPKKSAANVAFGVACRSSRLERGWAQEAFAARANIDRSYYGAIERGEFNVTLDTIVKVAAALEVSAAALLARARL